MANTDHIYYFPWIRKGLLNRIVEKDLGGDAKNASEALAVERASLEIRQEFDITGVGEDKERVLQSESTLVELIAPGDITSVTEEAILKVMPDSDKENYPSNFYPYMEFWEPDFLWRYTPAAVNDDKLRPWLALVVCKEGNYKIGSGRYGRYVSFSFDSDRDYEQTFVPVSEFWKSAHAQGFSEDVPEICRLLALRKCDELENNTRYTVFLIPSFETGRLKGLGIDGDELHQTIAQKCAWEDSWEAQKKRVRGFDFPVFYSWKFKTGEESFDALVEKLVPYIPEKNSIKVDVTSMGEGLDYKVQAVVPHRKSIAMPGATGVPCRERETDFPSSGIDEQTIRDRMKELLSQNSVFAENMALKEGYEGSDYGEDDPMIVPPVYGAKHVMATSLDEQDCSRENIPWLTQLNLSVQNRAVAGLGKRTVQLNQEEFMNRAWKQVEAVNALNMELYRRLLSYNSQRFLGRKLIEVSASDQKYIATLMQYLNSIKNVTVGKNNTTSISEILNQSSIPNSFATATFRNVTDAMSRITSDLDTDTLMENIVKNQLFRQTECDMACCISLRDLSNAVDNLYERALDAVLNAFGPFLRLENGQIVQHRTIDDFLSCDTNIYMGTSLLSANHTYGYLMAMFGHIPASEKGLIMKTDSPFGGPVYTSGPPLGADFLKEVYSKWMYFYTHDTLNSSVCGHISRNGEKKDLLVVSEKIYNAIFGNEYPITNLFNKLYVVCRETLLKQKTLIDGGYFDEHGKHISVEKQIYLYRKDPYGRRGGKWSYSPFVSGIIVGTPYIDRSDEIYVPEEYTELNAAMKYVCDYMNYTYDEIEINLLPKDERYVRDFAEWTDMLDYLRQSSRNHNKFSLPILLDIEKYVLQKQKEHTDTSKRRPQEIPADKVEEIRRGFNDEEAYHRMCDVAAGYYKKFFENSAHGEKLRNEYIDDLLRSKYPVLAHPIFPEPVYHYLKQFSDKFVLPCAREQLVNSVSMLETNPAFIEAYLCGMNTEMAKEMLWREYPTDERGSYFRKFWDCETSDQDIMQDKFFDIKPIHLWNGVLGDNHTSSKTGLVIFSVKGDLMRTYPDTRIDLHRASIVTDKHTGKKKLILDRQASVADGGIIKPVLEAYLGDDIYIVGFKTEISRLLGNPHKNDGGFFLAFSEDVEDLNFSAAAQDKVKGAENAAQVAKALIDQPSTFGKHVSLFLNL